MVIDKEGKSCNAVVPKLKTGSMSSNLKRDLQQHHKEVYNIVDKKDKEPRVKKAKLKGNQQAVTDLFSKSMKRASITISKIDFETGILKMVINDGVALAFFEGEGFRLINGELARNLGVPLGHHAIRDMVIEKANKEK